MATGNSIVSYLHRRLKSFQGVFGDGVHVSVVDDGLQYTHPDLMENYDQRGSWDWNDQDSDVTPHPVRCHRATVFVALIISKLAI